MSDVLRQSDLRFYEGVVDRYNKKIMKARVFGGLLLTGAVAEGSGFGYLMNRVIEDGHADKNPDAFIAMGSVGTVTFLALAGGSAYNFLKASWEKDDSQGSREVLERLQDGEYLPWLHSEGGAD